MKKYLPQAIFTSSILCFGMGMTQPIMSTSKFWGWSRSEIYLYDSVQYFLEQGELLLGILLLVFTFIFPILKYIFLGIQLAGVQLKGKQRVGVVLELINKWAMLDVFVVALIIVNLKMDSGIIRTQLNTGTTWFAASILLMMACSFLLSKK